MNKLDEDGQIYCAAELYFGSFIVKNISFPADFLVIEKYLF
jgi:hypothetical protein